MTEALEFVKQSAKTSTSVEVYEMSERQNTIKINKIHPNGTFRKFVETLPDTLRSAITFKLVSVGDYDSVLYLSLPKIEDSSVDITNFRLSEIDTKLTKLVEDIHQYRSLLRPDTSATKIRQIQNHLTPTIEREDGKIEITLSRSKATFLGYPVLEASDGIFAYSNGQIKCTFREPTAVCDESIEPNRYNGLIMDSIPLECEFCGESAVLKLNSTRQDEYNGLFCKNCHTARMYPSAEQLYVTQTFESLKEARTSSPNLNYSSILQPSSTETKNSSKQPYNLPPKISVQEEYIKTESDGSQTSLLITKNNTILIGLHHQTYSEYFRYDNWDNISYATNGSHLVCLKCSNPLFHATDAVSVSYRIVSTSDLDKSLSKVYGLICNECHKDVYGSYTQILEENRAEIISHFI